MKWSHMALVALTVITFTVNAADESTKVTPLEAYKTRTYFPLLLCHLSYEAGPITEPMPEGTPKDVFACIKDAKAEEIITFKKILKTLNPKAQQVFKDIHVAFIMALDGILPGDDELQINYDRRQNALKDKLNEAWVRFDVEQ